jgi:hypothetical protein
MMDAAAPGNGEQSYEVRLDAETATLEHFLWPVLRIAFVGAVAASIRVEVAARFQRIEPRLGRVDRAANG